MKTSTSIYLDYQGTLRQAEELERVAIDLKNLANSNYESCLSRIKADWTGATSEAYLRKANRVRADMLDTARKIERTASTLKAMARTTYEAEKAALAII